MKDIKVVELFAGVGGFRLGLERASKHYKTIYANQWEPGKNVQHAFNCYVDNFGPEGAINEDIGKIKNDIPAHDFLVGGFPCQDYSVATVKASGIEGKKGVLWWDIHDIIKSKKPKMILLENVDRLIKSPAKQKGRDFAIILYLLNKEGYTVEWKVINAADYGMPQKRRRVFIYAYKAKEYINVDDYYDLDKLRAFKSFKSTIKDNRTIIHDLNTFKSIKELSDKFSGRFWNTGIASNGVVYSEDRIATYSGDYRTMKDCIDNKGVKVYLNNEQEKKIEFLKSKKKKKRIVNGFEYIWSEGKMQHPENITSPFRTILTSETSMSRSTHAIDDGKGVRFITPVEAERANCFPDDWTKCLPNKTRYFVMGNALVVEIIEIIGKDVLKWV